MLGSSTSSAKVRGAPLTAVVRKIVASVAASARAPPEPAISVGAPDAIAGNATVGSVAMSVSHGRRWRGATGGVSTADPRAAPWNAWGYAIPDPIASPGAG